MLPLPQAVVAAPAAALLHCSCCRCCPYYYSPATPPATPAFAAAADELFAGISARFEGVECGLDPERQAGRGYYRAFCFHLHGRNAAGKEVQLADGGTVDWTQQLLSNAKECLVISGIGSERVCALAADQDGNNNNRDNNRTSEGGTARAG